MRRRVKRRLAAMGLAERAREQLPLVCALLATAWLWFAVGNAPIVRDAAHHQSSSAVKIEPGRAAILQQAVGGKEKLNKEAGKTGVNLFDMVNKLMAPALWIVVGIAPLAIAWGAGMLVVGGRHGPQIMAGAVIAVVLTAAAKGVAA